MTIHIDVECVSFEAPEYGVSVEDESDSLSQEFLGMVQEHIKKLIGGKIDPFKLQAWRHYRGVPLMMVSLGDELMVYAAEDTSEPGAPSRKISCMFVGARSEGYRGQDGAWDGSDDSLWQDLIETRCRLWFTS